VLNKALEMGISLHKGPIGNLGGGGGSVYLELCEGSRNGASLCGSSVSGTSFTGDPEGYVKEDSGDRHLFS
jgi:hypothetical protein